MPEARQELDTAIFDEEIDVKKARKYDNNIDFGDSVEKNFKDYAEGQGSAPGFFDAGEEEEEGNDPFSKMPSIKGFDDL